MEDLQRANTKMMMNLEEGIVKPTANLWMKKYTVDTKTAISVTSFAVSTVISLRDRIAKEKFHSLNQRQGGLYDHTSNY